MMLAIEEFGIKKFLKRVKNNQEIRIQGQTVFH